MSSSVLEISRHVATLNQRLQLLAAGRDTPRTWATCGPFAGWASAIRSTPVAERQPLPPELHR